MEVATVFLETSLGTCLAVSFPASTTTVADLKRRVSYEHAAAFPFIGQIAVQAIKVSRGGMLFHLTDSVPVRDAFLGAAGPWTLKVDALVCSAFGYHKRSLCETLTAQAQLEATHTETEREKHRVIKRPAAEIVCVLNEQCSIDDEVHFGANSKQETHLLASCVEQELKQGDQPSEKQVEDKEPLAANVCDGDLVPPPCAAEPTKEAFLLLRMDEDRCSSSRRGPQKHPAANPSVQSSPGAVPPMCYSLLKDLTDRSPSCRIRTRIARLWEHRMGKEKILVMLHMVLVDEEGQGIHAIVRKRLIKDFAEHLKEGRVYYFQNFETKQVKASKTLRCANHSCEVHFTEWTKVNPILPEPDDFPPYAYRLRSFKDILDTVDDQTYLADVVGLVTGISDLMKFEVSKKRIVRLYDGSDHAIIHLWGGFPDDVDADELIRRSESEPVILLAMGFNFDKEYSMLSLKTAYGCRICINPASDVSVFRNRIIGTDHLIKRIDDKGQLVVENTSVMNLVSEVSSSGAGHTDSHVDFVSAGDMVAEPTVSATTSDMKRKTRSSSKDGDNPRGPIEVKKKKIDNDPNRAWFKTTWRKAEEKWSQMMAAIRGNLMTPKRWSLGMTTSRR